ncbi:hypothetical protein GPX89_27090 [Nocardia sp. ET3-3]|uniref:Uncharacterized protein n=1 Tax=Nocardia terrae TaxID=2675851 RepID=A0A7K1V332_9NOCA|nr:hypothetical protein [Nocardia terrae]MVU80902.1 hypothetical protein [Nocardia terrae]
MPVTTLYDYQLAMLHPMCTSAPAQAAELLDRIGATRSDTAISENRWFYGHAINRFCSIAEYVTAWGAPDSSRVVRNGDHETRYAGWDLPFWPGLQLEFMEFSNHLRPFKSLVRRHDAPQVRASVADLTPWSCTVGEFHDGTLGPTTAVDGFGGVGYLAAVRELDPDSGADRIYWAHFDHGLLQYVEPAPEAYIWEPTQNL